MNKWAFKYEWPYEENELMWANELLRKWVPSKSAHVSKWAYNIMSKLTYKQLVSNWD